MDIVLPNRFSKEQWDEWRKWHLEKDQFVNNEKLGIKIGRLEMQIYKLKLEIEELERIKSKNENNNYHRYLEALNK